MPTTSTPVKTQGTSVFALATVATAVVSISSAIDVSGKFAGTMFVHFGRTVATALGAQCKFRIEASSKSSTDGHWYSLFEWATANGLTAASDEALTGTVNAGQNVLTCASTTGFVAGDLIFAKNGTIGNSEFHRIKSIVTNTSVTVEDNLVNAQTSSTIYDIAEWWAIPLDLSAIGRIRLVIDAASGPTGQTIAAEAHLVTLDSISSV